MCLGVIILLHQFSMKQVKVNSHSQLFQAKKNMGGKKVFSFVLTYNALQIESCIPYLYRNSKVVEKAEKMAGVLEELF